MNIRLTGKPKHVSREEVRAWIWATLSVLAYHNKSLQRKITVAFVAHLDCDGKWYTNGCIKIRNFLTPNDTWTTIVHELIHECCGGFEEDSDEKCTSTLTARMKVEIAPIAQLLLNNTYKRAAWLAHTKLSYRVQPGQTDHYDADQDKPVPWKSRYRRK